MTPNSKDALIPGPAKRRITRSATFKLGLDGFSSIGFFSSHGTTCDDSQRAEMSEELYRDAYDDVERAVQEYKARMEGMAQAVLHPERAQQLQAQPETNPFKVSQASASAIPGKDTPSGVAITTPATSHSAPSNEVEKQEPPEKSSLDTAKPPAETKRRGRPAKTAPAKAEDVPLALEHAAPNDPGQFKATDDDLPKAIGGTSEVPPGPDLKAKHEEIRAAEAAKVATPKQAGPQLVAPAKPVLGQWERVQAVIDTLSASGKRAPSNVEEGVKSFCKGFLNKPKLERPPNAEYEPIIPILERIAETNPGLILADPQKAGLEAGVGWNKLIRHVEKWREDLKTTAIDLAVNRYPDNPFDLLDFLHNTAKLGQLDNQLLTFMRVMRTTNAAIAMTMQESSVDQKVSMADMMAGLDLEHCTEGDILARISGVDKASGIQAGQPAQTDNLWQD